MAESKLGIYQLAGAYSPPRGLGDGTKAGNFLRKHNISVDTVLERIDQLTTLYGKGEALYNRIFKNGGKVQDKDGNTYTKEEVDYLLKTKQINDQQGRAAAENFVQKPENSQIIELLMMKMMADDKPKNNTGLYIGLGVGGVLLVGLIVVIAMKK